MHSDPIVSRALRACLVVVALVAGTGAAEAHGPRKSYLPFEYATIAVERNDTDDDTEVVIAVKGGDEGLKYLTIITPDGRRVVALSSADPTVLGLREFAFESPEPEGSRILAAYPQGIYRFFGESVTGERFRGQVRLSHLLPAAAAVEHPAEGAVVGTESLTLRWSAVPGVKEYIVEFENESVEPQQVLRVNVPASQTQFTVPAEMLVPGSDFQVGIGAVGINGNIVFSEVTFSTAQ